jgi:hypothetical protein
MFERISRVLVIFVMLVAFVGQALSFNTSVPCETSVETISNNISELVKHDDFSSIDIDRTQDCCGIDCCDADCKCIANACSSFVYFNTEFESTNTSTLNDVVYIQPSEQPKSIYTLLYRPPIFIS